MPTMCEWVLICFCPLSFGTYQSIHRATILGDEIVQALLSLSAGVSRGRGSQHHQDNGRDYGDAAHVGRLWKWTEPEGGVKEVPLSSLLQTDFLVEIIIHSG